MSLLLAFLTGVGVGVLLVVGYSLLRIAQRHGRPDEQPYKSEAGIY